MWGRKEKKLIKNLKKFKKWKHQTFTPFLMRGECVYFGEKCRANVIHLKLKLHKVHKTSENELSIVGLLVIW